MLDDDFTALQTIGQTALAFTPGTAEQQAYAALLRSIRTQLAALVTQAASDLAYATYNGASALLASVDAAGRLAAYTASQVEIARL